MNEKTGVDVKFYDKPAAGVAKFETDDQVITPKGPGVVAYAHYLELTVDLFAGGRVHVLPEDTERYQHDVANIYVSDAVRSLYAKVYQDYKLDDDDNTDLVIDTGTGAKVAIRLDGAGELIIEFTDDTGQDQWHYLQEAK